MSMTTKINLNQISDQTQQDCISINICIETIPQTWLGWLAGHGHSNWTCSIMGLLAQHTQWQTMWISWISFVGVRFIIIHVGVMFWQENIFIIYMLRKNKYHGVALSHVQCSTNCLPCTGCEWIKSLDSLGRRSYHCSSTLHRQILHNRSVYMNNMTEASDKAIVLMRLKVRYMHKIYVHDETVQCVADRIRCCDRHKMLQQQRNSIIIRTEDNYN